MKNEKKYSNQKSHQHANHKMLFRKGDRAMQITDKTEISDLIDWHSILVPYTRVHTYSIRRYLRQCIREYRNAIINFPIPSQMTAILRHTHKLIRIDS